MPFVEGDTGHAPPLAMHIDVAPLQAFVRVSYIDRETQSSAGFNEVEHVKVVGDDVTESDYAATLNRRLEFLKGVARKEHRQNRHQAVLPF
ncbi:hypothetical protein [Kribbella sp. NPDC050470]|uniref:hypothetical protein n=1 Tax=unclassified Kribbella TaxID=2644121 RepID=UPI00378E05BB